MRIEICGLSRNVMSKFAQANRGSRNLGNNYELPGTFQLPFGILQRLQGDG